MLASFTTAASSGTTDLRGRPRFLPVGLLDATAVGPAFRAGVFFRAFGLGFGVGSGSSGPSVPVFNPSHETQLSEIPNSSADTVDAAVRAAKKAQSEWGRRPAIERANVLREIATKKMTDMTAGSLEAAKATIAGTARSMGIEIV